MRFAAGPPSIWRLRLRSGSRLELWADAYGEVDGCYEFTALVEATPEEAAQVRVDRAWSAQSGVTCMVVARIPRSEVLHIEGGWSLPDDQQTSAIQGSTHGAP